MPCAITLVPNNRNDATNKIALRITSSFHLLDDRRFCRRNNSWVRQIPPQVVQQTDATARRGRIVAFATEEPEISVQVDPIAGERARARIIHHMRIVDLSR